MKVSATMFDSVRLLRTITLRQIEAIDQNRPHIAQTDHARALGLDHTRALLSQEMDIITVLESAIMVDDWATIMDQLQKLERLTKDFRLAQKPPRVM